MLTEERTEERWQNLEDSGIIKIITRNKKLQQPRSRQQCTVQCTHKQRIGNIVLTVQEWQQEEEVEHGV